MNLDAAQTVYVPAECPVCGGRVCITGIDPPTGEAHCHDTIGSDCGWSMILFLDPAAGSFRFVSVEPEDSAGHPWNNT